MYGTFHEVYLMLLKVRKPIITRLVKGFGCCVKLLDTGKSNVEDNDKQITFL